MAKNALTLKKCAKPIFLGFLSIFLFVANFISIRIDYLITDPTRIWQVKKDLALSKFLEPNHLGNGHKVYERSWIFGEAVNKKSLVPKRTEKGTMKKNPKVQKRRSLMKNEIGQKKQSKSAATILYYQYRYDFFQITRLWQWFLNIYYKLNLKYFCKDLSELADVCQKWLSI